jgi:hypothetical protein
MHKSYVANFAFGTQFNHINLHVKEPCCYRSLVYKNSHSIDRL